MFNRRDLLKLSSVAAGSLLLPTGLRPTFAAGGDITIVWLYGYRNDC
jgi:hypothetical protein